MSKNLTYISKETNWRNHNGVTLRLFREHLGVSQAELALVLGVSRATIISVESRNDPSKLSNIWKIAIRELLLRPYDHFPSVDGRMLASVEMRGEPEHA